ncbi:bifunctional hydroxymethylpyrimidine kinase/phosphomethylpyrimidine kinase [Leuconostoc miyukkimchii]|uniref:bifunctional hydroxymethylpyrimidine kinase/phosphomethylpyrimidine kinase n=1 Tax=Leuconostoc miyukkimchii TaxID=910540 RepID=UPI001C7E095F|nr:bifunctional hydroxymethylpyrimidine kinase/phosphomethylpyrimidine kinase [Leuconostoc miyukkimchii]
MPNKILTIAGSDSLAGGGIQSDLATFNEYGYFGLSVMTSIVTVKSRNFKLFPIATAIIEEQLQSVLAVDDIVAIKVGLLPTTDIITLVTQYLSNVHVPIIIDPVMVFKETTHVDTKKLVTSVRRQLLPLATIVTPNIREAQIIANQTINTVDDMKHAAKSIFEFGAQNVLVKGGTSILGDQAVDVLFDGCSFQVFKQDKIQEKRLNHNGAGCTLSASIATNLGRSADVVSAIADAKDFVWQGIKNGVKLNDAFDDGNVWQGARRSNYETKI